MDFEVQQVRGRRMSFERHGLSGVLPRAGNSNGRARQPESNAVCRPSERWRVPVIARLEYRSVLWIDCSCGDETT